MIFGGSNLKTLETLNCKAFEFSEKGMSVVTRQMYSPHETPETQLSSLSQTSR